MIFQILHITMNFPRMQCRASEQDTRDGEESRVDALPRNVIFLAVVLCTSTCPARQRKPRGHQNNNGQWQFLQTKEIAILLDQSLKEGNQFELGNLVHQTTRGVRNRLTTLEETLPLHAERALEQLEGDESTTTIYHRQFGRR